MAVNLAAYWRPTLKGCPSKHYYPSAEKALPAIVLGNIARVGSLNGQRVAIVHELVRVGPDAPSEAKLQTRVVTRAAETLAEDEILVFDAGFKIRELRAAGLDRHKVRLAKKFTARRNVLPLSTGQGHHPEYGDWRLLRLRSRPASGIAIPSPRPDACAACWSVSNCQGSSCPGSLFANFQNFNTVCHCPSTAGELAETRIETM